MQAVERAVQVLEGLQGIPDPVCDFFFFFQNLNLHLIFTVLRVSMWTLNRSNDFFQLCTFILVHYFYPLLLKFV